MSRTPTSALSAIRIRDILTTTLKKLKAIHLSPKARYVLSAAALVILLKLLQVLVLKRNFSKSKGRGYVSDLDKVGQRVGDAGAGAGVGAGVGAEKGVGDGAMDAEYDIIVVGGGTTGCALAARLSENPNFRVLLLEAGGSGSVLEDSSTPSRFGRLLYNPVHVHGLRTEPQKDANEKRKFWPRAKMLGGCSSINAQMAQYGAFGDFDEWATYIGDESWAWKNFGQYFRKFEAYQPHPDYPLVDASARGRDGPVHTGFFNTITPPSEAFVEACVNVGIRRTHDFNGREGTLGAGRIMTYVDKNYQRVSAETAYLTPEVLKRKNLTVAIHATATRVLFDTPIGLKPRAVGVEFGSTEGGSTWRAYAKKDVIVSGGAIHSPHILMLSGIGPADQLKSHGITPIVDLPGVGQHLVDHPVVDLYLKDKFNCSPKWMRPSSLSDVLKLLAAVFQYRVLGTGGPLAMNFGECAAFVRSDDEELFPEYDFPNKLEVDSTSAPDSPDLEIFSTPMAYTEHGKKGFDIHTFGLHVYLLRPTSRGAVLLKSANPWVQPSVNPNYLSTPEDLAKLVRGVRLSLRIAHTPPLKDQLDGGFPRADLDHFRHLKTNAELEALVRERVETVYHPASTARMAPQADGGVVDSRLRVYGVDGLRVADASIFPWIVSGHTAGACFAVAEKLADEIKLEYGPA